MYRTGKLFGGLRLTLFFVCKKKIVIDLMFKRIMPVLLPPAILGPEMAAPSLWAPGIFWLFLLQNPHAHKIPRFREGGVGGLWKGGVEVPILFIWA